MCSRMILSAGFVIAFAAIPVLGDDAHHASGNALKSPAFENFKALAGEWEGEVKGGENHMAHVKYHVTAGGSAVVETTGVGTAHEMVTVIHPDGEDLVLTHYCMLGNQPQMRASTAGDGKSVAFKFVRVTNLKSEKAMHMHDATFTFIDKDTMQARWVLYDNGKPAREETIMLRRKK